jgi:hypothetical protein
MKFAYLNVSFVLGVIAVINYVTLRLLAIGV